MPHSFRLNDDAPINIMSMSLTLDTSQVEMSPLNDRALTNINDMSVTLKQSHVDMSPLKESV